MFKITATPTFKVKVQISIPGSDKPGSLEVEFRHMGRAKLREFLDKLKSSEDDDADNLMVIIQGWSGADVPFSREALEALLDQYPASARELFDAFLAELATSKRKN